MRKGIDASEYKHIVLGLVFLKHISDDFSEIFEKLKNDEYSNEEDRDEYLAENVFWEKTDNVRAKLRVTIKKILQKYGYPPDVARLQADNVWRQSENLAERFTK